MASWVACRSLTINTQLAVLPVWIVVVVVTGLAPRTAGSPAIPQFPRVSPYLFYRILYWAGCRRHLCRLVLTLELNRNWLLAILTRIPTTPATSGRKLEAECRCEDTEDRRGWPAPLERRICWKNEIGQVGRTVFQLATTGMGVPFDGGPENLWKLL